MGSCWIEQTTTSSSNSYEEDFEYEQEAFTWRQHARDMPKSDKGGIGLWKIGIGRPLYKHGIC